MPVCQRDGERSGMSYVEQVARAAEELRAAAAGVDPAVLSGWVAEMAAARRVVCFGVGREGLMMRALGDAAVSSGAGCACGGGYVLPAGGGGRPAGGQRGAGGFVHRGGAGRGGAAAWRTGGVRHGATGRAGAGGERPGAGDPGADDGG